MALRRKRVLILSAGAGAGHVRAAEALEHVFREKYPHVHVTNVDALDYTHAAFRHNFTRTYNMLVKEMPTVWAAIYQGMEEIKVNSTAKRLAMFFDRINSQKLKRFARDLDPDAIICTHMFPAETMAPQRLKGKLRAPLYMVLTDFEIHTMWIINGVNHYFVATQEMAYALKEKGIGDAGVSVTGIPTLPVFGDGRLTRQAMRRRLGLAQDRPTVLLCAGGFGLGDLSASVNVLAERLENAQLLAVAGRNPELSEAFQKLARKHPGRVFPFGFVDNMHEMMAASDFMVGKSGGLTSSECLVMGLPMVILAPIPGQEERNSDYLLECGVAVRAHSPAHMVYKATRLLADPARLSRMRANARAVAMPHAAKQIAEAVVKSL